MSVIVISEQGTRLTKKDGQLLLFKEAKKIFAWPLVNVTHIILIGMVEMSPWLVGYLFKNGVDTAFMSMDGRYKGRLSAPSSKNILIRQRQFEMLGNQAFRTAFARAVVNAKVRNYARLIQKRTHVVYQSLKNRFKNLMRSLRATEDIRIIRGLEGAFSNIYFRHLPALLYDDFGFKRRIKHPPPDPLNILLSFAYTVLFNHVYAFVESSGLDPFCGFFHDISYGHPALVSDLMEEFRAPVADSLVLTLVNRKLITPDHFENEDGKIRFSKEGIAVFFEQYRLRMNEKFTYKNKKLDFFQIIEQQVWQFMNVLKGDRSKYEGYISR